MYWKLFIKRIKTQENVARSRPILERTRIGQCVNSKPMTDTGSHVMHLSMQIPTPPPGIGWGFVWGVANAPP